MSTTSLMEGEGPYARLASRFDNEEKVRQFMKEVVVGVNKKLYKKLSERQIKQIQDFYARELYYYTKDFGAKKALSEYMFQYIR